MDTSHYLTLGLSPAATAQEIKDAYRQLVRRHHPDANPLHRDESEALMKEVLVAYATLSDPEKRARYDRDLALRQYETRREIIGAPVATPQSLIGKVRLALGDSSDDFAAKLGLSQSALASYEARDAMPQTPLQMRTFARWVEEAALHLEKAGRTGDAIDLRTSFGRKRANRNFFR